MSGKPRAALRCMTLAEAKRRDAFVKPGSAVGACSRCITAVWVSPSALADDTYEFILFCEPCADAMLAERAARGAVTVFPEPTDAQLADAVDDDGRPLSRDEALRRFSDAAKAVAGATNNKGST